MIKAKDMNQAQITHTFCNWCKYRLYVLGNTYWECSLEESKRDELCPYRLAVRKEEQQVGQSGAAAQ
jgi:hypothetical protein